MENRNLKFTNREVAQRVVTFLTRDEIDFLDRLGKDAMFSTGMKISRAKLISWLIEFIEKFPINGEGIRSEIDFEKKIMGFMGQIRGQFPPATEDKKSGGAR